MVKFPRELLAGSLRRACFALLPAAIAFLPAVRVQAQVLQQPAAAATDTAGAEPSMPADPPAQYGGQKPGPGTPPAQQPPSAGLAPSYPGVGPLRGPVETTIGPVKVRFYGTLLLNISASDSVELGQDVPLWALPGTVPITFPDGTSRRAGTVHDTIFTARQSVFGLTLNPGGPLGGGWTPSALVEFDFFGSRPSDSVQPQGRVLNQPRLRLAYLQVEKGMWKIVAGQDKIIISPLDPVSLSHVAVPLGATAGDLWGWLPQVRLDATHKFGETTGLLQVGVLRPQFADPRIGDAPPPSGTAVDSTFSGFGERAVHPFYQARYAISHALNGSTATVGIAGHYGRERVGAQRTLGSWASTFDVSVPLHSRLILRGEGFAGSNLVPFQGGVLQGLAAVPASPPFTRINRIGAGGGWGELTVRATEDNKNIFYFGAGTDDPRDRNLLPGSTRSKNTVSWASYFRKLTDDVTLAFEWSNWQFRTRGFVAGQAGPRGPSGRGNVFNLALAYQF